MDDDALARFRSLLEGPSPAVLTTYRRDESAMTSPVWFRLHAGMLEVIIALGDVKLKHLARRKECGLTVFEAVRPFRGVDVRGAPELAVADVTAARSAIATRYLGAEAAARFVTNRKPTAALLRLSLDSARYWDLAALLPEA